MDKNFERSGLTPELVYSFLQNHELFNHLSEDDLRALASNFQISIVPAGTLLMEENRIGEDLFLILNGRVSVYKIEKKTEKVLAELGPGEVIGEISILIESPRTASVKTIRDSVLLKLNKQVFDEFTKKNLNISLEIAKNCIKRLIKKPSNKIKGLDKTIALVPLSNGAIIQEFIHHLKQQMAHSRIIDAKEINKKFSYVEQNQHLVTWLNDQEFHHEFIYYLTDIENTPWTKLCMRQADAIYFLCDADRRDKMQHMKLTSLEEEQLSGHQTLFLLHKKRDPIYSGTKEWIILPKVDDFFHLVPGDPNEIQKALRIMTGKSIGLVLSGGGARGAAHVGLIRALEELKIPIDMIGGTSIGGIIAALYSLGYDYKSLAEHFREIIVTGSKLDVQRQ